MPPTTGRGDGLGLPDTRYRALVDAVATDVWRASPDGSLLTDLPQWRQFTGQGEHDVLGEGWLRAVHPDDAERAARAWRQAVEHAAPYRVEYRIRRLDGQVGERSLQVRGEPVLGPDGRVVEYVGLTIDVTDRLLEAQESRRLAARLQAAVRRVERLQAVTAALSSALTPVDVAQALFDHGRQELGAAGGGVSLVDDSGTRLRYEVLEGYPTDVKATWRDVSLRVRSPGTHVLRTRQPLYVGRPEDLMALFPDPGIASFVEASQERSWVRVPLQAHDQVLGVLGLGWREERGWDAEDRAFLAALASVGAQALERAQAYQRQRDHNRELQRSLLPTRLPRLEGLELWAEQRTGTSGLSVGGDWCDAFVVGDGRVALVVGDVRGKGAPAAAVMGRLRGALRAYAVLDPDPAAVLERLDRLLLAEEDPEEIATLSYALLDPQTGEVQLGSAGHLPALLVRDRDCALLPNAAELPLGVAVQPRSSTRLVLQPETALLLVTDGLLDERSLSLDEALEIVRSRAAAAPRAARELVEHLLDGAPDGAPDDLTVLVAARRTASSVRTRSLRLPEDLRAAREARRHVQGVLDEWYAPEVVAAVADDVLLLVSELVTNAVVHARSEPVLVLLDRRDTLAVEVHDGATDEPARPRAAADEDTNGRGLALLHELSEEWGTRSHDDRKTVWFSVRLAVPTASAPQAGRDSDSA